MEKNQLTYHEQLKIDNTLRMRELLKTMPGFARDYFRAIELNTSTRTRISYAYDIRVFFQFSVDTNPLFKDTPIPDIPVSVLDQIRPVDLKEYMEYLKVYGDRDNLHTNGERGLKRKIVALSGFYAYYFKRK